MNIEKESIFGTKEEEIEYLQKRLEEAKKELAPGKQIEKGREILKEHARLPQGKIAESYWVSEEETAKHIEAIKNEPHQKKQVEALLKIAKEKGVWNALKIAKSLENDHLIDDFHARLIAEKFLAIKIK